MKTPNFLKRTLSGLLITSLLIPPSACQNDARAELLTDPESTPQMTMVLTPPTSAELLPNPDPEPTSQVVMAVSPPPSAKKIKIALLLDTSNSMDGLIDQAKAQLWKVVNELALAKSDNVRPTLEIALYQYGNDGLSAAEGYIQMVTPLTTDLDEISSSLFRLSTNGGSEFCGYAISNALNQLDWSESKEDYKVIFIAGNEPFGQGSVSYEGVCRLAKTKGIIVNTIHCGNFQVGINQKWKHAADLAYGKYMSIEQNTKTEYVTSPYDDRISTLNVQLNNTYIAYGSNGDQKMKRMHSEDDNASSYSSSNLASRAISKSSHVYTNSEWDLVDAAKDRDFKLDDVEEKTLPTEMQQMENKERIAYIQNKAKERLQIQKEIQKLATKRKTFISEQTASKSGENQLGSALLKIVREQAQAKAFVFSAA